MKNFDKVQQMPVSEARALFTRMSSYRNLPAFTYSDSWMKSKLSDNEIIMDVGVGNGENARDLAQSGHSVIGVDVRNDVQDEVNQGLWEFRTGSADCLPSESSSVSAIWANRLIHHLPDPDSFYSEAYRVLRPNGKLLVTWPIASDFLCSDPIASAAIREFLASGVNNINPASLADTIDLATSAGFYFVDSAFHSSRHFGPTPPYQLSNYYSSQYKLVNSTLPPNEARAIESFMFSLAQGNEWIDISLTSAFFVKP